MNMKLIRLFFACFLYFYSITAFAQEFEKNTYKAEIGVVGGASFYLGDDNNILFNNQGSVIGAFFRYNFDPRLALKAELINTTVYGSDFDPNNIYAGDITAEFNFFDLERNPYKRFSKPISPYIFGGLGIFTDMYAGQFNHIPEFISLPFGFGLKLKLGHRLNANIQWTGRLSLLSDNMEDDPAFDDPNGLNGTNVLNNDFLSAITVGFSFDIWKKKCDCLNNTIKK